MVVYQWLGHITRHEFSASICGGSCKFLDCPFCAPARCAVLAPAERHDSDFVAKIWLERRLWLVVIEFTPLVY
jgi:hypothetical protein